MRRFTAGGTLATAAQQSVTNIGYGISFGGVLDLSSEKGSALTGLLLKHRAS